MENREKPICIYKLGYLFGSQATFLASAPGEDFGRCSVCAGYDENCRYYTNTRRYGDNSSRDKKKK